MSYGQEVRCACGGLKEEFDFNEYRLPFLEHVVASWYE